MPWPIPPAAAPSAAHGLVGVAVGLAYCCIALAPPSSMDCSGDRPGCASWSRLSRMPMAAPFPGLTKEIEARAAGPVGRIPVVRAAAGTAERAGQVRPDRAVIGARAKRRRHSASAAAEQPAQPATRAGHGGSDVACGTRTRAQRTGSAEELAQQRRAAQRAGQRLAGRVRVIRVAGALRAGGRHAARKTHVVGKPLPWLRQSALLILLERLPGLEQVRHVGVPGFVQRRGQRRHPRGCVEAGVVVLRELTGSAKHRAGIILPELAGVGGRTDSKPESGIPQVAHLAGRADLLAAVRARELAGIDERLYLLRTVGGLKLPHGLLRLELAVAFVLEIRAVDLIRKVGRTTSERASHRPRTKAPGARHGAADAVLDVAECLIVRRFEPWVG